MKRKKKAGIANSIGLYGFVLRTANVTTCIVCIYCIILIQELAISEH